MFCICLSRLRSMHPLRILVVLGLLLPLIGGAAAAEFTTFTVKDIRVEGLQRIEVGTVYNYLPVHIGESLDETRAAEAVRALYKTGFFSDIHLERDGDVLIIGVVERPFIAAVKVSGNKDIGTDDLKG